MNKFQCVGFRGTYWQKLNVVFPNYVFFVFLYLHGEEFNLFCGVCHVVRFKFFWVTIGSP